MASRLTQKGKVTTGFLVDFLGICPGERLSTYPLMECIPRRETHFLGGIGTPGKVLGLVQKITPDGGNSRIPANIIIDHDVV